MSQSESSIGANTIAPSDAGVTSTVGAPESSSPSTQDTSLAPQSTASTPTAENVQGSQPSSDTETDFLDQLPSIDELKAQAGQGIKYADALASLKGAFDPLKANYKELQSKYQPYQDVLSRFEQPEQLQEVLGFRDSIIAWENDPVTGEPVPAPNVQFLQEKYRSHADYLVADLLNLPTVDPETGREVPRADLILEAWRDSPERRAHVAKVLGLVEPSAIAPQWQPTEEELSLVRPELQDVYRKLPYEEREELKLNSPEFINRALEKEQFQQQLIERDKQTQEAQKQQAQQREQYLNSQAQNAGTEYVNTQLNQALTTFHESVVQQCNFIKPLDPANLPQGVTPEQAAQMNQQIAASNKAEAAQITGLVVSLFNPQTQPYVLPLLKEIGAVDDKMLSQMEKAASAFGNNGRNYGNLNYRQQLQTNGNGYQPSADVTGMNNEAQRALKTMIGYANQIRGKLMEQRSNFFSLKATEHNQTLNGAGTVRPPINGTGYNPTTAPPAQLPSGKLTRADIDRLYG